MTVEPARRYGLRLGTGSSGARASPSAATHKSCASSVLRLEHPLPKRQPDLLVEDDVIASQSESERTPKNPVQFWIRSLIGPFQNLIDPWLKFQGTIHFRGREQRMRIYRPSLESNLFEPLCGHWFTSLPLTLRTFRGRSFPSWQWSSQKAPDLSPFWIAQRF
jgi:hypothetical protein